MCSTTGSGVMVLSRMPEVLEEHRQKYSAVGNGRFLGDPSKLLGPDATAPEEEEEEEEVPPAAAEEAEEEEAAEEFDEEGNPIPREPKPAPVAVPAAPKKARLIKFTEGHRLAWTVAGERSGRLFLVRSFVRSFVCLFVFFLFVCLFYFVSTTR